MQAFATYRNNKNEMKSQEVVENVVAIAKFEADLTIHSEPRKRRQFTPGGLLRTESVIAQLQHVWLHTSAVSRKSVNCKSIYVIPT